MWLVKTGQCLYLWSNPLPKLEVGPTLGFLIQEIRVLTWGSFPSLLRMRSHSINDTSLLEVLDLYYPHRDGNITLRGGLLWSPALEHGDDAQVGCYCLEWALNGFSLLSSFKKVLWSLCLRGSSVMLYSTEQLYLFYSTNGRVSFYASRGRSLSYLWRGFLLGPCRPVMYLLFTLQKLSLKAFFVRLTHRRATWVPRGSKPIFVAVSLFIEPQALGIMVNLRL